MAQLFGMWLVDTVRVGSIPASVNHLRWLQNSEINAFSRYLIFEINCPLYQLGSQHSSSGASSPWTVFQWRQCHKLARALIGTSPHWPHNGPLTQPKAPEEEQRDVFEEKKLLNINLWKKLASVRIWTTEHWFQGTQSRGGRSLYTLSL